MAKLTKQQAKAHREAEAILTKDRLSEDEREYVFRHWHEGARHMNGAAGAHFTPFELANDFAIDGAGRRVIDLCAGIGVLSYFIAGRQSNSREPSELVCVEINPHYVAIGKKLVPEARWICADLFDWRNWHMKELEGAAFDMAISNPPFGRTSRSGSAPRYSGPHFEYHAIDIASELADNGAFIVPQVSAGFAYSGRRCFERENSGRAADFERTTAIFLDIGCGVDTSIYRDQWHDVSPLCEIVTTDFTNAVEARARVRSAIISNAPQMSLF